MAGAEAAALARDALEAMRKDMTCELWCDHERFILQHSCNSTGSGECMYIGRCYPRARHNYGVGLMIYTFLRAVIASSTTRISSAAAITPSASALPLPHAHYDFLSPWM